MMRRPTDRPWTPPVSAALAAVLALSLNNAPLRANPSRAPAADAIADRFAADADAAARKKAEADRLARDKAEADRRARLAREAAEKIEVEKAETARRQAEQLKADEAEMLDRARAEAPDATPKPPQPRQDDTAAGLTASGPSESMAALEARRQAESDALAEKLRRAREALAVARAAPAGEPADEPGPAPPDDPAHSDNLPADISAVFGMRQTGRVPTPVTDEIPAPQRPDPAHVTVLLVIDHGTRGIRRFDNTGDPILCIADTCFIGAGADKPALRMPRKRAFGPGNTLGKRAGACSHSLTCVLRDVDLGADAAMIQPIDLRLVRHDRREPARAWADDTCAVQSGRLTCRQAVAGNGWRAWIVPERVAREAGQQALEAALYDRLPAVQAASRAP